MQVIRKLMYYLVLGLLTGCIYEFNPDLEGSRGALVINGKVTDQEGYQYIEISRSTAPYDQDHDQPVSGYAVEIEDDRGNRFPGEEMEPGLYGCWMDQAYLFAGTRYRLKVTSDLGRVYQSTYDEILACPDIDSITWEIQDMPTENPEISYKGVQFFVNTDCSGDYAKNLRWEMEETWEYHSTYAIEVIYDGTTIRELGGTNYDYFYCWESSKIPSIYTYSTRNLSSGQIRNFPLHYVSSQSDRFSYKYSTLVKQFSLSPAAFEFWNTLDKQSKQSGELYETQPAQIYGNIYSLDEGGEAVLGLFYATAVKEKRIFAKPRIGAYVPHCEPFGFSPEELTEYLTMEHPAIYPVYLYFLDFGQYDYANQECFDCRMRGGTTTRPDFWE
jgi:hypothetical protein